MAVALLVLRVSIGRLRDMTPYAITTGELRDRLFALAKPTGVPLQNIYLLPMRRSRMVNAFAVKNNTVMVTDYLLKQLNKDEVDGIMAHELAHLQLGHPRKLMWQMLVAILGLSLGFILILSVLQLALPGVMMLQVPLTIAIGLGWTYATSRRFEYQADAQAALITGNPKALISGLVKVARLNQMPLQWGKLGESMMTHPSMQRRVMALAQRYDVPDAEVDALVSEAAEGFDSEVRVAEEAVRDDRYDLSVIDAADETLPLFSSEFKQKTSGRLGWLIIWGGSLAIVMLGRLVQGLPTPGVQWLGYGAAAAILAGAYGWLLNIAPVWGYDTLGKQLAARLSSVGFVPREGEFVGFAPSAETKSYEGHTNWDVGFLFLRGQRLCYIGEQLKFAISAGQVTRTVVKTDTASLVASATVAITWQRDDLASHTFILQPLNAQSTRHTRALTQALQERIETWQATALGDDPSVGLAVRPDEPFKALTPPVLGDVTSQPLQTFSVGMVVSTWLVFVVIACAITTLTGSLFISWPLSGFILSMATAAAWSQCLPALRRARQASR